MPLPRERFSPPAKKGLWSGSSDGHSDGSSGQQAVIRFAERWGASAVIAIRTLAADCQFIGILAVHASPICGACYISVEKHASQI